jgi:hypothetical protein
MSLDIPERQVLIFFAADATPWHHRVLITQIDGARWALATPDFDIEVVNLAAEHIRALGRNAPFPAGIGNVYGFDNPIEAADLASIRLEGRRLAEVLGAAPAAARGPAGPADTTWRYADPAHTRFGDEIGADIMSDVAKVMVQMHCALVDPLGDGHWTFAQCVRDDEVLEWTDDKRSGAGRDPRLGPTRRRSDGVRASVLREEISNLKADVKVAGGWPFQGPAAMGEFIAGVVATGHECLAYGPHWIKLSGLSPQSGLAIEFLVLITVLHFGITMDQLNPLNLVSFEMIARRLLMIQKAVKRNFKAPDFEGLEIYLSHSFDTNGGITTQAFDKHISDLQKSEAQIMKHQRLFKEEADTKKKDKNKNNGPQGGGP